MVSGTPLFPPYNSGSTHIHVVPLGLFHRPCLVSIHSEASPSPDDLTVSGNHLSSSTIHHRPSRRQLAANWQLPAPNAGRLTLVRKADRIKVGEVE